ncbi:hypothetical protein MMC09_004584 [Bachmanniomyces sp. S44760]|nr:hypothetical protein [Bachmanniomyces sp. S44760]
MATMNWIAKEFEIPSRNVRLVIWGQSLGAGVATFAASVIPHSNTYKVPVSGLILETPFVSVERMLMALYPQKWLPYRYLGIFLRNHWDSGEALRGLSLHQTGKKTKILIMQGGRDEVVPPEHGRELEAICKHHGLDVRRVEIPGALHTQLMAKNDGRQIAAAFIKDIAKS